MQFEEEASKLGLCPICKENKVPIRTTRGPVNYCSRTCASQARYATRYRGTMSGPKDRPTLKEKTKLD